MSRMSRRSLTALLFAGLIGPAAQVMAVDRTPAQIVKDLAAAKLPELDASRRSDPAYVASFRRQFVETATKRDALIAELYKLDPDHASLPELMREHWRRLPPIGEDEARLKRELDDVLVRTRNESLRTEAFFARAFAGLFKTEQSGQPHLTAVEEFVRRYPKDERSEQVLYIASRVSPGDDVKKAYEERLVKEYPDSNFTAGILGARRRSEGLGKPFDLEFTDAITGSPISIRQMKGKIVVIDFWATWCAPCVATVPKLKGLYEKYHRQGVEFIGVSLDNPKEEGGLESLKAFVTKREIPWPQYYQGNGWESKFSRSWGINALPSVFVLDAEGNLYSDKADEKLDEIIPRLLDRRDMSVPRPATGG